MRPSAEALVMSCLRAAARTDLLLPAPGPPQAREQR